MIRVIHEEHNFSDRFVAHMLKRNVRVEEGLVDQLLNSSEKRLARALLLIARYGNEGKGEKIVARAFLRTRLQNDWKNPKPGQFLHEQIFASWIYQIQRRRARE